MIAKLQIKTQYGKQGTNGINLMPELDEEASEVFAHDVQSALEWCKSYPLYQEAIVDDLTGGRFLVGSQWRPYVNAYAGLVEVDETIEADFTRSQVFIIPVNTVYENVGFQGGKGK